MKHIENSDSSVGKKLKSLFASVVIVLAAVAYLLFGEQISKICDALGIDFSKVSEAMEDTVAEGELAVHFIDVGQGDAILLCTDEAYILIDAGTNSSEDRLVAYLDQLGVKKLDCFVCTHPHEDHIGGADKILNTYEVAMLLEPNTKASTQTVKRVEEAAASHNVKVTNPKMDDTFLFDSIKMTILSGGVDTDGGNDSSIVLRIDYGNTSFMFTGDAETTSEIYLLNSFSAEELKCDVLKVGHHGSNTSTGSEFLTAVSPSYAIISCGEGNTYGHPNQETLTKLTEFGLDNDHVLRTDKLGSIILKSDGKTISKVF